MKVAIRTDASPQIGTGHFARCLTLADVLKARGAKVVFVARRLTEGCAERLAEGGHQLIGLQGGGASDDLQHAGWLGGAQSVDAAQMLDSVEASRWDWVVVDHYALDFRWERLVRGKGRQVMVIDDLADRAHDCDLLLDQNLYLDVRGRYDGLLPSYCTRLLGPRYALLRPEFSRARAIPAVRRDGGLKVLVFFGGVDASDATGRVVTAMHARLGTQVSLTVVIGIAHPRREALVRFCAEAGYPCHVQTRNMASLMADADLCVGASGSATWERCVLGLPAIVVSLALNQRAIAQGVSGAGAAFFAGEDDEDMPERVVALVAELINDNARLEQMSAVAKSLVDGRGADRVVDAMLGVQ